MMLSPHRTRVRSGVAAVAALIALLYVLIAQDVITVIDEQADASNAPVVIAAVLFGALAAATITFDRRAVYLLGGLLQVLVIAMYLAISSDRTPAFEAWGIAMKVLQVGLLATFALLFLSVPERRGEPAASEAPSSVER